MSSTTPMLDILPSDSNQIVSRLRQVLSTSGLFYEAHQARWAAGEHPLELLLLEPQARLSNAEMGSPAEIRAMTSPVQAPPGSDLSGSNQHILSESGLERPPAHPDTLPIIQQQLSVLETGQVFWHGQVWPGQSMNWELSEYQGGQCRDDPEHADWETSLGLDMQSLGAIAAKLRINQGRIEISLTTDRADKQRLLQQYIPELANALGNAGLSVSDIRVNHHGI